VDGFDIRAKKGPNMKHLKEARAGLIGLLAGGIKRTSRLPRRIGYTLDVLLQVILTAGMEGMLYAGEANAPRQWNIMVVPANQTAFSGQARELFEKNCASCHSKDGRAQTPVARQRHVQDLSECTLTDEGITQQILRGTHDKAVDFKMPSFCTKLSEAEVGSLVPLVKAFRPVPLAPEGRTPEPHAADRPRLVGIIDFPLRKYAVLEKAAYSERYFMLAESERHDGVTLERIKSKSGNVQVRVSGLEPTLTLKLAGQHKSNRARGFLHRFFAFSTDTRHEVKLESASTDLVLFLQAQFTGRTLLRSPRLPETSFSLQASGTDSAQIALALERALAEKGIATVPDGNRFLLVVPTSELPTANPHSSSIGSMAGGHEQGVLFPGGAFINFPHTDLRQVVKLYSDFTGLPLDQTQPIPSNCTVKFTTQTALNREECAYALETLIRWQGVKLAPLGNGLARH
jgi:mono/diheme cytochrome c family protein